jgi:tetratricopeptide (TPR) repeat protein
MTPDSDWERRRDELWAAFDDLEEDDFLVGMERLVAELDPDDAVAHYERGSALDSTGHSDRAVPEYRRALELGLGEDRRRQAVVQMASSLRNLGEARESAELLRAERERTSDELDDAVDGFRALALADSGREREALGLALTALAGHMTRYSRSLTSYARELIDAAPPPR